MKIAAFLAFIFILSPATSFAIVMSGKISAVDNLWVSAQNEQDGLVPSEWELPLGLPTGESLIPGSVMSNASKTVTLSNGNESIHLDVSILGIQYMVDAYDQSTSDNQGTAKTSLATNSITVKGMGLGDKS
ncbi:hypothetical protein D1115_03655 [Vibrio alfacsensis]|uniref:Uncharacterized protein n=1 Tax=Vibrio alfacsensis TaxID=1074311 RepID=A0ABN5PED1_9VIBR|nr:hypothetical protein [Vibrio alfacsensis]AXY00461.1 hypothetical protein D1115_03655 [Vibrio alfacsensis]